AGPCTTPAAAQLTHHHPAPGQRAGGRPDLFLLTDAGHRRAVAPVPEPVQGVHRLVPADAVGMKPDVALELPEGVLGQGAEDPVDPSGVEAEPAETALEFGHVVAPQVGGAVVEQTISPGPAGLDQRRPRL